MPRNDDSSLDPEQRRGVEERARALLHRAEAWGRYPTPVEDILAAARLRVAPKSAFNPVQIMTFIAGKTAIVAGKLKTALSKVFGIYDAADETIHIDHEVAETRQRFLSLHETGHHELPVHKKLFRIFQDCEKTLAPEVADLFEREANNFARFAMFQGNGYAEMAADFGLTVKSPMALAKKFGASIYASAREFVRTNHRACAVYVLEPIEFVDGAGAFAVVRRIEVSPAFAREFGTPSDVAITVDHPLGSILPIGRRMTRPTSVMLMDLNGLRHDCVADAFDTTHNVILLVYPAKALTATTIILPGQVAKPAA